MQITVQIIGCKKEDVEGLKISTTDPNKVEDEVELQ
jgi:hypothetical protein